MTEPRGVGPFVARTIRELLDGSRPMTPPVEEWPPEDRALYESTEISRDNFIAVRDAHLSIVAACWPRPHDDLQMHTAWSDGAASPRAMVAAARKLGYRYPLRVTAVSKDSYGVRLERRRVAENWYFLVRSACNAELGMF